MALSKTNPDLVLVQLRKIGKFPTLLNNVDWA